MFIRRKVYKRMQESIKILTQQRDALNKEVDRLYEGVLQDSKYAILVKRDTIALLLWNDGRIERDICTIDFHAEPGSIPELYIKK